MTASVKLFQVVIIIEHLIEFSRLAQEKQSAIINAAISVFAAAGYKKAYVSEIAKGAGISKALVFYYFGSKKALYLYLIGYVRDLIMAELNTNKINANDDFFDRIKEIARVEMAMMKQHPGITHFINSMYFERDPEIIQDLQQLNAAGVPAREDLALNGVNFAKFKANVDPKLVVNILVKFTEGVISSNKSALTFEASMDEFEACLDLLKNNLYKEEYLG
ncbi:MAG: TetR/AcrR family transcriptional regulator [Firmicutes bacterium]|nr:TetR/AcrR family transcriptional regulator [Bacillota bacterium]